MVDLFEVNVIEELGRRGKNENTKTLHIEYYENNITTSKVIYLIYSYLQNFSGYCFAAN